MMHAEQWRPVVGYEGLYSVSSLGNVRSEARIVARKDGGKTSRYMMVLRQQKTRSGYFYVGLWAQSKKQGHRVASIVATAFLGPRPFGHQICHCDGKRTNNAANNLRYDTPAGNNADKLLHGTAQQGMRNGLAKLTDAAVLAIRADRRPHKLIAAKHGINKTHVSNIKRGICWAHLPHQARGEAA